MQKESALSSLYYISRNPYMLCVKEYVPYLSRFDKIGYCLSTRHCHAITFATQTPFCYSRL